MFSDLANYFNEVDAFVERLMSEPGVHSFRGCDYRSVDGEIQVFDTEEKRWMGIEESLGKNILELHDLLFGDDPEEEENSCEDESEDDDYEDDEYESDQNESDEYEDEFLKDISVISDVDINGYDVTCTFYDGEKQTAHCDLADIKKWSLETGISICLGKYLAGGSGEFNRVVHKAMKLYQNKLKAEAKRIKDRMEEERILENKKRKRERYLKRRAERLGKKKESEISVVVSPETSAITLKKDGKVIQVSAPYLFNQLSELFSED